MFCKFVPVNNVAVVWMMTYSYPIGVDSVWQTRTPWYVCRCSKGGCWCSPSFPLSLGRPLRQNIWHYGPFVHSPSKLCTFLL